MMGVRPTCLSIDALSEQRHQDCAYACVQLQFTALRTCSRVTGCLEAVTELIQQGGQPAACHLGIFRCLRQPCTMVN